MEHLPEGVNSMCEFLEKNGDSGPFIFITTILPLIATIVGRLYSLIQKHCRHILLIRYKFRSKREERHFFWGQYLEWIKATFPFLFFLLVVFNIYPSPSKTFIEKYYNIFTCITLILVLLIGLGIVLFNSVNFNKKNPNNYRRCYNIIFVIEILGIANLILFTVFKPHLKHIVYIIIGYFGFIIFEVALWINGFYKFYKKPYLIGMLGIRYLMALVAIFIVFFPPVYTYPSVIIWFLYIYLTVWIILVLIEHIIIYQSNILSYIEYQIVAKEKTWKTTAAICIANDSKLTYQTEKNPYYKPFARLRHQKEIDISSIEYIICTTQNRVSVEEDTKVAICKFESNQKHKLYYHQKAFSTQDKNWMFFYLYKNEGCQVTVIHSDKIEETEIETS